MPSIGTADAAVAGVASAGAACAVVPGLPGDAAAVAAAAAVVASPAGDGARILRAGFALVPPLALVLVPVLVLLLGSTVVPAPEVSPTVMALIILMCRFAHGRFSCEEARADREDGDSAVRSGDGGAALEVSFYLKYAPGTSLSHQTVFQQTPRGNAPCNSIPFTPSLDNVPASSANATSFSIFSISLGRLGRFLDLRD